MWVGGTAAVAVLLLVAGWFLLIEPVTAAAAEDSAQTESQLQQNELLELEIIQLQEQFTHMEEYRAELAALRLQMPTTGDGASISRELQDLASAAGVTITAVAPSVPQQFVATVVTPEVGTDETAPAEDAAADGTSDESTTDGTTDASAPLALPGFYAIPISMTSIGSYEGSVAFLRSLQTEASRLYLVSTINAVTQEAAGSNAGRPATNDGDIELTIAGYAYVLTDSAVVTDTSDLEKEALPVPSGQGNPFAPVG
ncbi:hypothetical protein EBM89_05875 [Cellulomonas triticagri]|uniref:Pilus assembly protein PilO n=1 Tax=Cellulomonas triticagri TaxID=2483352 RepID=A0A3M2JSC4_9CELL|nr:hypothetical protein EBM89_05875 [Cellulomonas triticagri]